MILRAFFLYMGRLAEAILLMLLEAYRFRLRNHYG